MKSMSLTGCRRMRLLLLLLLALVPALLAPKSAQAVLQDKDVTYYSDATLTTVVGECYFAYCGGGDSLCWGRVTTYKKVVFITCGV